MHFKRLRFIGALAIALAISTLSCKKNNDTDPEAGSTAVSNEKIDAFIVKYPEFGIYKPEFEALYKKHNNDYIWYDEDGRIVFADALYNKSRRISEEGVSAKLPYEKKLADLFDDNGKKPDTDKELLISGMYFFYTHKVYEGVDKKKSRALGWYLPREKMSYVNYLDTLLADPDLIRKDESEMISQYYNLKKGLLAYRAIRDKGGWNRIDMEGKSLKPGSSSPAIVQIRKRLYATGELKSDSGSAIFDSELADAIAAYRQKNNMKPEKDITPNLVNDLNVSVEQRIKTIIVNMERCRWIDPDIGESKELVAVNIPSYTLRYIRDGKIALESGVVVGKQLNQTVVFSGKMSYLVFSPYWNIPESIIESEIKPGMKSDKKYLEKHDMEWNNGHVRQKPGEKNSLGLIKFMFPNSNNIYLHDSPAKSLYNKEDRAFSHGCVRVEKARELAVKILDGDKNWTLEKIDEAMHAGKESTYGLNRKIPVYIAYFTAWADENGNMSFYDDVYKRDDRLAHLLYTDAK
ncbi:MAG TPA: L,D-transpeptidase family protein [Flavobacterium sp.]|nr:L,D-transpeptidase family protein [Flavobacterium sp.]